MEPWPCHPQLQPPRARLTSSDASQLSHWCSPNPFPNERLARPSLSRPIGWLCWVVWTNGEGVELQTEWKWPRETEGDTERERDRDGERHRAGLCSSHTLNVSMLLYFCFCYDDSAMNHHVTYIWAPSLGENWTDIITWQLPSTCSILQSVNSLLLGSLLPECWCASHCRMIESVNLCMQMCVLADHGTSLRVDAALKIKIWN